MAKKDAVSTESYKGVRDFYPRDAFVRDYILETMRAVCERYGYERYDASILESTELYEGKTSEEIVNEQTYTFTDRGERSVTLRPEMTPTLARMVAARRRELPLPIRWYSTPNVFRYERPQKGRLREHWQLNADLLGVHGIAAETEMLLLVCAIMREFGATNEQFEIRINDRRILDTLFETVGANTAQTKSAIRLLDRRAKMDDSAFTIELTGILGEKPAHDLLDLLARVSVTTELEQLRVTLAEHGVTNVSIDTTVTRGFDYYTGIVFEVYDTSKENARSIFGGGRYDNLLAIFGAEKLPAVGFGMGDVTMRDFLETHGLLPEFVSATELMLCPLGTDWHDAALALAEDLRAQGVAVAVNLSGKKIADQIKAADKLAIPFIACYGEDESGSDTITLKHLPTHKEVSTPKDAVADAIFSFDVV